MPKINKKILSQLQKRPGKPFIKISEELGISPITVKNRYERMKKEGKIFGTSTILDLSKIGYQGKAFLHITNDLNENPERIIKNLQQIPNVFLVSEIIGAFDILVMAAFRDLKEIKEITNRIRDEPSVKKVEMSITDDTLYPLTNEYTQIRL